MSTASKKFFGVLAQDTPKKVQAGCGLALRYIEISPKFRLASQYGPRQTNPTRRVPLQELSTGPRECRPRLADSGILAPHISLQHGQLIGPIVLSRCHRASDSAA